MNYKQEDGEIKKNTNHKTVHVSSLLQNKTYIIVYKSSYIKMMASVYTWILEDEYSFKSK